MYVNRSMMSATSNKVLVNPKFTRQVHINPNFNSRKVSTVFVNPDVFNNLQSIKSPSTQEYSRTDVQKYQNKQLNPTKNMKIGIMDEISKPRRSIASCNSSASHPIVSKYSKINNADVKLNYKVLKTTPYSKNNSFNYISNNKIIRTNSVINTQATSVINNTFKPTHITTGSNAVINTKMKLVRKPQTLSTNTIVGISNAAKVINSVAPSTSTLSRISSTAINRNVYSPRTPKQVISRHKLVRVNGNSNHLKTIVKSKYKLIRSGNSNISPLRLQLKQQLSQVSSRSNNRFKIDNRTRRHSCTIIKSPFKLTKKAYMMRLNPRNSIIKNTTFKLIRSTKQGRYSIVRKTSDDKKKPVVMKKSPRKSPKGHKTVKYTKRNLVKINKKKLKKNNIPCEMYNRKGQCKGLASGKCSKKHDPNQIQICIWFLQGICRDDKCTLSHKVSPEKMPTCKFYLEGMCHKDNCPYLHVKLGKDAPVCVDFLHGYCAKGLECDKRHQFLCPDFERDGKCTKKLCRYPHGKAVRQYKDTLLRVIARNRKSKVPPRRKLKSQERKPIQEKIVKEVALAEIDNKRYYECSEHENLQVESKPEVNVDSVSEEPVSSIFNRPKLGLLPSFIAL